MPQENGVPAWVSKLGESYSQIQFGPGVVGKTSRATLALLAVWGVILFRLSTDLGMNTFLVGGGLIATMIYKWWVDKSHTFAEKHPDLALMEGAQLIEYRKFEAQAKGLPPGSANVIPGTANSELTQNGE